MYVLFQLGICKLQEYEFKKISSKISPNGKFIVSEYTSLTEGGHAPYGEHLVLNKKREGADIFHGYIIFAGYCEPGMGYSWDSDGRILIKCKAKKDCSIMTQAQLVYGIKIEVYCE